jgi:hypothetical protein
MMTLDRNVHGRTLRLLDRLFPPNPRAFMSAEQQTAHEVAKALEPMVAYLAELGKSRTHDLDVLDDGWLVPRGGPQTASRRMLYQLKVEQSRLGAAH